MFIYLSPVIAFVLGILLTWVLVCYRGRWAILDHPNARSLHEAPRPRSGGIAILLGVAAGSGAFLIALPGGSGQTWLALSVVLVAAVSLVDDVRSLPAFVRLAVHGAAAIAVVVAGNVAFYRLNFPFWDVVLPGWMAMAGSILYIVWMLNLYNFMDGIDGLAGGMALIGFGTFTALGWLADAPLFATLSACIAAASGGFVLFNFAPARIFMGDVGAGTLGFLAALFTLWGARSGIFPFWAGVLVFSPFVVDATWTLLRRIASGEKPWQAHRVHAYQRVVQAGWSHRRTTVHEYLLMTSCGASAILVGVGENPALGAAVLLAWILIYGVLGAGVSRLVSSRARSAA